MIAILIGAIFLILMGVIDLTIPASYILSFGVFVLLFGGHGFDMAYLTAHLCGGGLMLGAFFMATAAQHCLPDRQGMGKVQRQQKPCHHRGKIT